VLDIIFEFFIVYSSFQKVTLWKGVTGADYTICSAIFNFSFSIINSLLYCIFFPIWQ